jgi:hypothetical protein
MNTETGLLEPSLNRLVNGLVSKDFKFVTPEATTQQMREQVAKFDKERTGLTGRLFALMLGGTDMPDIAKTITKHIVAFGAEDVNDAELATLQQLMRAFFPLSAIAFSKVYGPRFVAIVDGDDCTQSELSSAMDRFEQINLCIMPLGGRLSIKLFGKSILGINASTATGSLLIAVSNSQRAGLVRRWVKDRPLHSDTMLNQLKERFGRWQFWAKAVVGMVEYKPHQLRQEAIVLDAQTGSATSTASPRVGFEFGFALSDIAST